MKFGIFIILPVTIFLFFSCATTSREEIQKEASAHYKLAISHLNEGKIQLAFVELQKAIKLNPGNKRAYNALGLIYQYFENMKKAEESLLRAIQIDPQYSEAYNNLGVAYMRMRQWDKAVEAFKKAISNPLYLNPEKAFANLGKVYYRKGDYDGAIKAYKNAIKRAPDFYTPYYGLALCYNAIDRYGDASEALTEAIRVDPSLKGDREKAEEVFIRQKLKTTDREEEQDYVELIEILRY